MANITVSVYITPGVEPLVLLMADGQPVLDMTMNEAHGLAMVIQKMIFKATPEVEFVEESQDASKEC